MHFAPYCSTGSMFFLSNGQRSKVQFSGKHIYIYIINMSAHVQINVQLRQKLLYKRVLNPCCYLNMITFFKFSLFYYTCYT